MVKTRPRTFCQWKSPPKLICSTWTSSDRKISARTAHGIVSRVIEVHNVMSVEPDFRSEELGVPNHIFVARRAVQPGPIGIGKRLCRFRLFGLGRCDASCGISAVALDEAGIALAPGAGIGRGSCWSRCKWSVPLRVRLFSSASSSSMRAFMAASSFAMSVELAGSGAAAGRAGDTSGAAAGSCRAATFAGASGCAGACA